MSNSYRYILSSLISSELKAEEAISSASTHLNAAILIVFKESGSSLDSFSEEKREVIQYALGEYELLGLDWDTKTSSWKVIGKDK